MHYNRSDWNHFRTALAVARAGNLSKAAKALDINQSTASRHLFALENDLGTKLFLRSRTSVEVTEAGRLVVAEAEAMESAMLNAFDNVGRVEAQVSGLVRFVAVPWIGHSLIAPRLPAFWAHYPAIEVQAIADTRERMLDRGEVDLSLRFDTHPHDAVEKVAVGRVVSSVYFEAGRDPSSLPWMGFRENDLRTEVESWLIEASKGKPVRFWANDAGSLHQAVRAGAGKALLPDFLGARDPLLARLPNTEVVRTLWLQVLPEVRRLKRVSAFIDWIEGIMADAFHPID